MVSAIKYAAVSSVKLPLPRLSIKFSPQLVRQVQGFPNHRRHVIYHWNILIHFQPDIDNCLHLHIGDFLSPTHAPLRSSVRAPFHYNASHNPVVHEAAHDGPEKLRFSFLKRFLCKEHASQQYETLISPCIITWQHCACEDEFAAVCLSKVAMDAWCPL